MHVFPGNANTTLTVMLDAIHEVGLSTAPRGRPIRELLHAVSILQDPRERVLTQHGRRANPFFQAAETVWILAGSSEAAWLTHFNAQMEQFLDADGTSGKPRTHFHAAYGERMRRWGDSNKYAVFARSFEPPVDQIQLVLQELRKDPESRRAVMIFGNPEFDKYDTKDRPCNIAFTFKLREGKLHLTTFNRSNDVILGLTFTNIVQFTTLQEVVASELGVDVGPYYHYSDSLHLYSDDPVYERLVKARPPVPFDVYKHVRPTRMHSGQALRSIQKLFRPLQARDDMYGLAVTVLPCPYWRSVGLMIQAYDALKEEDFTTALRCLEGVGTEDWLVACLEYLVRWVRNRFEGDQRDHRYALIGNVLTSRGFHHDVWSWVFHEGGEV